MTSHNAIRDSVIEMSRRVGRHSLDVPEMKQLMERIERSQPGPEFSNLVRQTLLPIAQHIPVKNFDEIAKHFPDFHLKDIVNKVPTTEQDAVWQALGMTNMLLTTLQMVPPEMLTKIETMTNTMMGAMQNGGALNDLFKNMGPLMGNMGNMGNMEDESYDDDEMPTAPPPAPRPKKKGQSKQQEFRDKLC